MRIPEPWNTCALTAVILETSAAELSKLLCDDRFDGVPAASLAGDLRHEQHRRDPAAARKPAAVVKP